MKHNLGLLELLGWSEGRCQVLRAAGKGPALDPGPGPVAGLFDYYEVRRALVLGPAHIVFQNEQFEDKIWNIISDIKASTTSLVLLTSVHATITKVHGKCTPLLKQLRCQQVSNRYMMSLPGRCSGQSEACSFGSCIDCRSRMMTCLQQEEVNIQDIACCTRADYAGNVLNAAVQRLNNSLP